MSIEKNHIRGLAKLKSPSVPIMVYNHGDITFREWGVKYLGEAVFLASNKDRHNRFVKTDNPADFQPYYIMGEGTNDDSGHPTLILWDFSNDAKSKVKPHQEELSEIHVQQLCAYSYTNKIILLVINLCCVECFFVRLSQLGSLLLAKRLEYELKSKMTFYRK